jgi:dihydroorotase
MKKTAVINGSIVNERQTFTGNILIEDEYISLVKKEPLAAEELANAIVVDAKGKYVLPGVIDTHVHFREPGLTSKAGWASESRAALAGGVTFVVDMPNTIPNTTTTKLANEKNAIAQKKSLTSYACYIGATADNIEELVKLKKGDVAGVKVFMGSSTGNMLLSNRLLLSKLFAECQLPIVAHCEDDAMIKQNMAAARQKYGNNIPFTMHPVIRSEEACYRSTEKAVALATKYGTRLHVAHISTARELSLFSADNRQITAEACPHYLWFCDEDYEQKGAYIKCNPAIKTAQDREALRKAFAAGILSTLGSDHAPHLPSEKQNPYAAAPSGMPLVQHSLVSMLELTTQKHFSLETLVQRACHAPAGLLGVKNRGYIRPGCYADITIVDPNAKWVVGKENILYKCGWSPFQGVEFSHKVVNTFVNGSNYQLAIGY